MDLKERLALEIIIENFGRRTRKCSVYERADERWYVTALPFEYLVDPKTRSAMVTKDWRVPKCY